MANFLPPFRGNFNSPQFVRWLEELYRKITAAAQLAWSQLDFTGSNLTDLATRNHADLQNINTASYTHLTAANHTDLTDAEDSALHYHATDRARANHSGAQAIATVTGLQTALDGKVDENTAITGAEKTKITYDAKGLVTAGADATTADIADSADKRYVTDAQLTVIGNTSGTNTGDQTTISGNAGTATALQTARTINGVSFDGTANITVADSTKVALAGVAGGQTINGGTAAGETLMLKSTAHATKGKILFGTSAYDEANNRLGVGTASPGRTLEVSGAGDSQLRVRNTNGGWNYMEFYNATVRQGYFGIDSNGKDLIFASSIADGNVRVAAGNVGIGATLPTAKLEVKGTGTTTGVNFKLLDSADAVKFTVLDNGAISAVNQITSTLATGTSPFAITSTTKNTNLNADLWDGLHSTDVPNIKQNISLTAQVAAIGTTAITGTNTAGLYRVSYSLLDTTADLTAGTIMVNFTGTDEAGAFTMSSVALPLTALGRTQGTFFLRILGTGSVSYSTTLVGIIGTSQYGLFISAEKIL